MKFGKVLTYKDLDEAKRLIGKKFVASNVLKYISDDKACQTYERYCLEKIFEATYSFRMSDGCAYRFIREVTDEDDKEVSG